MRMYVIRLGVPQMKALWEELRRKAAAGSADRQEEKLYKQLGKAMRLLAENPRYPGLRSHEISALSARYGMKVWESYLENNTPAAGRLFWVYGPGRNEITVIGLEPHPEDKKGSYDRITLSSTGEEIG